MINVYDTPPVASFVGNIQPCSENSHPEAYGIVLQYAYFIYASADIGIKELDRVSDGVNTYEIKVIQRWRTYVRLMAEQVKHSG
jgi:hypothetical protein